MQSFEELYQLAKQFRESSRFQDAADFYYRALHTNGVTAKQRLWVKFGLSDSLRMTGRHIEAITYLGELYIDAMNQSDLEYAYDALYMKIDTIRCIEESQGTETPENFDRRLKMIEDGLQWLKDIGRYEWRHALLYNKAYVLWSLGNRKDAMDAAEEGYSIWRYPHPSKWERTVHARQLIDYAMSLGQYKRAAVVLDEMENINERPHQRVRLLWAKARLLRKTLENIEALEVARRAAEQVNLLQTPRENLYAYIELTKCAIASDSFSEALAAIKNVHEIAIKNQTIDRPYLVRNAQKTFEKVKDILNNKGNTSVKNIAYKELLDWIEKIVVEDYH